MDSLFGILVILWIIFRAFSKSAKKAGRQAAARPENRPAPSGSKPRGAQIGQPAALDWADIANMVKRQAERHDAKAPQPHQAAEGAPMEHAHPAQGAEGYAAPMEHAHPAQVAEGYAAPMEHAHPAQGAEGYAAPMEHAHPAQGAEGYAAPMEHAHPAQGAEGYAAPMEHAHPAKGAEGYAAPMEHAHPAQGAEGYGYPVGRQPRRPAAQPAKRAPRRAALRPELVRSAVIWSEILDRPKALRRYAR